MTELQLSNPQFLHYATPSLSLLIALTNCLNSISNQKPIKEIKNQIFSFVQRIGPQGQKLAILSLMQSLENQNKDKIITAYKSSLLIQLIKQYAAYDSFFSYFPEIITKVCKENKLTQLINNLINNLKFTQNIQIAIALSLYLSDRSQLIAIGETQLINKLKQYVNNQKPTVKLSQKLLEELLFQINISPQLSAKLEGQSKFLLEAMDKINKGSNETTRIYNYFRDDWQYFANQTPVIEKLQPITLKKSDILRDLGPSATQQIDTLKAVMLEIGPINQQDIFECLMMMTEEKTKYDCGLDRFIIDLMYANSAANNKKSGKGQEIKKVFNVQNSSKKTMINWNFDNFLQFAAQNVQNIKWQNVLSNLDRQNLTFVSEQHFVEMMKIFDKIKKLIKKWSISDSILLKKWAYPESQAQFLIRLYSCKDAQCMFFNQSQSKKGNNPVKQVPSNPLRQIWGFQQLLTLLFEVSEYKTEQITQVFNLAISKYPDILIKTLSQIKPQKGQQLLNQIYNKVFPQFLQTDTKSIKIIQGLWKNNKQIILQALNDLQQNKDQRKNLRSQNVEFEKIVDIFKYIEGSLEQIIEQNDYRLAFPLAFIGAKKQCVNLQNWIASKLSKNESKFCKQVSSYFENNLLKQLRYTTQAQQKQNILEQAQLSIQILNKIFTILIEKLRQDYPNSKNNQAIKKLHKDCCKLIPELAQGQICEQAERQCEQEIKKIYKEQISIKDAVQNLKKLKNSNKKEQRQNFANRITFLCIQLTYHHSYPQKQLMITADLFSALINANLVQKKIYQTFLHVIDEYLKQQNQQFAFAMKVMENIKQKLAHQSWFCEKLIDNELVMKKNPELVQAIIKCIEPPKVLSVQKQRKIKQAIRLKNAPPESYSRHIIIEPQVHHHIEVPQKSDNVEYDILATLDKTKKIQIPDREAKLRQINTIFNTLSMANVQQKAKQLKKAFDNQKTIKLLAHSLVFKRITIAQNNGIQVFVKLIQCIPRAEKPVVAVTYKILQHWFNLTGKSPINDKKFTNFKNIGAWLGRMTIGKGYPIPIYKLNIKQILAKSFQTGTRLNLTIPTILKILQSTPLNPEIFHPQSPWLRRIFCILNQININLKQQQQQLKSQIKAFFRSSKFDIETLLLNEPSILNSDKQMSINQLIQKLHIGEDLIKFCEGIQIRNVKMLVVKVLDVSIMDIVEPVIDRTVKIAIKTTRSMIIKDFATESNIQKLRQSSVNLVKQLAAPLAQVTCREPLKLAITKNLRDYLKEHAAQITAKQQQLELLVQKVLQQTLDTGCGIIKQKAAKSAQKAIKEDPAIVDGIQKRNYLKREGESFFDDVYMSIIPSIVPIQLRNDKSGLSQEQYGIYMQLKKIKRKQINSKTSQRQQQQSTLIQLLQQKQPVQLFRKLLPQHVPLHQQFIQKIHTMLLDESNTQSQISYYLQICQELRQYCDQHHCWRLFKQVSDLKANQEHQMIVKKLVRQKYFQETVLGQILQVYHSVINMFQKWVNVRGQQQVLSYLKRFQQFLQQSGITVQVFFYNAIKFVLINLIQNDCPITQCFNPIYSQAFSNLFITYYYYSKSMNSVTLALILESIISSWQKVQQKYSINNLQRYFNKVLISTLQYLHQPINLTNQQSNQKIVSFVCIFAKKLQKINPIVKPSFCFAWLQLICNKFIMKNLLQHYQYWDIYFRLLCSLLKFMNENMTQNKLYNQKQGQLYQSYYKAVMKLIVVLMHDYLKFVSQFSLQLCVAVDSRFVQLKNIIISAYPLKQFDIPLKFQKRQDFQQYVQKIGYPKYYKLTFDKPRLNYYLNTDVNDPSYKQKMLRNLFDNLEQDDLFLQTLVLYLGWSKQNSLSSAQSTKKLTEIISSSKDELRFKFINYIINLIRYPNYITLFFIDFVTHILIKQKDNSIRQLMLTNIITRMAVEVPIAWGMIYLMNNVLMKKQNKDQMKNLGVSNELLEQF